MKDKQVLAEAREARKRPPEGQRCEHPEHEPGQPSLDLRKVYYDRGRKLCYEWWCDDCYDREGIEEFEDGWPVGDDGKFMTPVRCEVIPGLD